MALIAGALHESSRSWASIHFARVRLICWGFTRAKLTAVDNSLHSAVVRQDSFPKSCFFHECCGSHIRLVKTCRLPVSKCNVVKNNHREVLLTECGTIFTSITVGYVPFAWFSSFFSQNVSRRQSLALLLLNGSHGLTSHPMTMPFVCYQYSASWIWFVIAFNLLFGVHYETAGYSGNIAD